MNFKLDFENLRLTDLHTHTVFSDGDNTPAEMIEAAVLAGLTTVGISDHSYTFFDESYCMKKECIEKYKKDVNSLKYSGKINVLCGIEQDFFSAESTLGYDYVIGSVHYINPAPGVFIPVDENPEIIKEAASVYFSGDIISLCEEYYKTIGSLADRKDIDIIGHFDLISKFNEGDCLFDSRDARYVNAWERAVCRLLDAGHSVFEINMGAVAKGYRKTPYPSAEIIDFIKKKGGKFILSSDAHSTQGIAYGFQII